MVSFTYHVKTNMKHRIVPSCKLDWFLMFAEVSAGENQKLVEPVAKLHKILKFRLASFDKEDEETKTTNA